MGIEKLPEYHAGMEVSKQQKDLTDKVNELVDAVNQLSEHTHSIDASEGYESTTSGPYSL